MATIPAVNPVPTPAPVAPGGAGAFPQHPSGSLYVGDLAPDVTEAILFEIFNRAGAVSSIRVCRDATTRRSLGYAYVNYHSVLDAERALDMLNFSPVKDRPCRIMWSHRDPAVRKHSKSNVFIKNLAPTIDSKQLYDTFSQFGSILSCKIAMDAAGHSRGFGYVHFETDESATKAIDGINGHTLADKAVYVGHFERRTERTAGPAKFTNVYVKSIPGDWDEARLTSEFSKFGKVTSVCLRRAGDKHTGLCFGFVNFETHEEAQKAVEDGKSQGLFCDRFQKKGEREQFLSRQHEEQRREKMEKWKNLNLYVKNIEEDVDDAKLREMFAPFGTITSCKVMIDDQKVSRGFGFVCFENVEDANKALAEMNGKVLGNKPLYVNRAQTKDERRVQLEHSFMAGQRMQPMAMFFPPNLPMQAPYMAMQPQFRGRMAPPPNAPAMRGYPQGPGGFFPGGNMNRGGRGRGGASQPPATRGAPYANMRGGRGNNMSMRGGMQQMGGQPRYPREQQPIPQQMGSQELSSSMLASATPEMQKQILGERLYPLVYAENPKLAAKITGMFLEMETSEILQLLEATGELKNKVSEAMRVLEQADAM
jgi:polyadenylate-binding protein